ncbi:prepilin peptidase [Pseudomonas protegens]|uniref:A24 family peptidase n=1 Tax=Pseudomonas protegens TaxID=380021 RepID=UPI00383B60CE
MGKEQFVAVALLLGLLGIAVVSDLRHHRIPNLLVLLGFFLGLSCQAYSSGLIGLGHALLGSLIGFAFFLPLYALGGMAAGDVKLMAMVGTFLTPYNALWAAFFSLICGGVCGVLVVLLSGQTKQTVGRYWLMWRARAYFSPAADEVAGKPFAYSVAVLLGTLTSLYWLPLGR